jgi:Spy/CpxP family protein refolding chaperone
MVSKKKIVVAVITATALSIGVAGTASAHGNGAKGNGLSTILSDLVKKGTLTQAQVDAINAAKETAQSAMRAAHDAERAALEALVAKTIGVDAAVIKSRLAAGESLGAIAGTKKDALIAVLVAEETKRIDAAVTAGKLTAAQATTMKAGLVAHVTAEVNSVGGPKGGPGMGGPKGGRGHGGPGMGDHDGRHGTKGGMTPPPAGTTTGTTASYKA